VSDRIVIAAAYVFAVLAVAAKKKDFDRSLAVARDRRNVTIDSIIELLSRRRW